MPLSFRSFCCFRLFLWIGSAIVASAGSSAVLPTTTVSSSPVIGVLTQPVTVGHNDTTNATTHYIIAASYVKWLEAGGARSIPIPYDAPPAVVDDVYSQINGVLLPGGASDLPPSVVRLLTKSMNENAGGRYFPVWGTCLGFEYLVQFVATTKNMPVFGGNGKNSTLIRKRRTPATTSVLQDNYDAENISLPLFRVKERELYRDADISYTVRRYNVTMNNHHKGISPHRWDEFPNLPRVWDITSRNRDRGGRPFVSTIEPRHPEALPWYGVQYHPEKNAFEYGTYPGTDIPFEAIDHSERGVRFSLSLARFFVDLARKSQRANGGEHHAYTKPSAYPLVNAYPIKRGIAFEEYYVIPSASVAPKKVESEA